MMSFLVSILPGIIPFISLNKIHSIGNAAGQGAEKLLLSENLRDMADRLPKKVHYIELSSHHDFQKIFADSLFFGNVVLAAGIKGYRK